MRAEAVAEKANLVAAFGYGESQLDELRHPTRDEFDAMASHRERSAATPFIAQPAGAGVQSGGGGP